MALKPPSIEGDLLRKEKKLIYWLKASYTYYRWSLASSRWSQLAQKKAARFIRATSEETNNEPW